MRTAELLSCACSAALHNTVQGFNPANVAEKYGDALYIWDWTTKELKQTVGWSGWLRRSRDEAVRALLALECWPGSY